jgi:hypothetical protein
LEEAASKKEGSLDSAVLVKMGRLAIHPSYQQQRKEPLMVIMQDALPNIKTFLKPVVWSQRAQRLAIHCLAAFLFHLGKMSASTAAGAVRTDSMHRAQISRFLGRRYWRRLDLLNPLRSIVLELESKDGTWVFCVDQTLCGQQGHKTENTFSRGNTKKRAKKSNRKQKQHARRSCHCFVMGLLITPSGIRVPFSKSYYTQTYCEKKQIRYRTQTDIGAELIRELPVPEGAFVVVVGDTAFEAKSIREACQERKFSWIVPVNPERVLAGEKPRPKVSSLANKLRPNQMAAIEVHPSRGKYVDYRRIARCRIGPKLKARTYYVHEESRAVKSVGTVRLVFSTTLKPAKGQPVKVQKILMTNDETLSLRDVLELFLLRWQIELFFKELKSTLGMHHYRFREFEKVEAWVQLVLATFLYLEWTRARTLKKRSLSKKERRWWAAQRTYGLARAIRQTAEQRELDFLADAVDDPAALRRLRKLFSKAHPPEYRAVA